MKSKYSEAFIGQAIVKRLSRGDRTVRSVPGLVDACHGPVCHDHIRVQQKKKSSRLPWYRGIEYCPSWWHHGDDRFSRFHQFCEGVSMVIVNGQMSVEDGADTGAIAGRGRRRGQAQQ